MNQRERETDCDRREAGRNAVFGRAENDLQKEPGQNDLDDKAGTQRVSRRRMLVVAVRCEAIREPEVRIA